MPRIDQTIEEDLPPSSVTALPIPGVVTVFLGGGPKHEARALAGETLSIGREEASLVLDDDRLSRKHASVSFSKGRFTVTDHESRNGTFLDGERVSAEVTTTGPALLRVGRSLLLLLRDVRRHLGVESPLRGGTVIGPTLADVWADVARHARTSDTLLITGESGTGKELAARAFHDEGPNAKGPLIAVNCAAIPAGLAERLLFGTRKGAYSGATANADGYVQAAHGGTLFLDELGELDPAVQAKLLRVLESREVWPLGAERSVHVDTRVCGATLRNLEEKVKDGGFRADLYYRIAKPAVRLPALRERIEDIPWLLAQAAERVDPGLAVPFSLVEACILRRWNGNVRELIREAMAAAQHAKGAGRTSVEVRDLDAQADPGERPGATLAALASAERSGSSAAQRAGAVGGGDPAVLEPEQVMAALRRERDNVTRAARALGLHRNQLRRWLAKHPEVQASVAQADEDGPTDEDAGPDDD